eukprot:4895735-Prymnesium_polylepis.1
MPQDEVADGAKRGGETKGCGHGCGGEGARDTVEEVDVRVAERLAFGRVGTLEADAFEKVVVQLCAVELGVEPLQRARCARHAQRSWCVTRPSRARTRQGHNVAGRAARRR